jgi:hypothetical protein
MLRWLTACGALGVAATLFFKPGAPAGYALELAAYGFLDGIAGGMLLGAATHRLLRARLQREAALEAATRMWLLRPGAGG